MITCDDNNNSHKSLCNTDTVTKKQKRVGEINKIWTNFELTGIKVCDSICILRFLYWIIEFNSPSLNSMQNSCTQQNKGANFLNENLWLRSKMDICFIQSNKDTKWTNIRIEIYILF